MGWVRLPKTRWPKSWIGKYKDPVVPLRLALYGHPDSGGLWEIDCTYRLGVVNFVLLYPDTWPSLFYHHELQLLLIVYVDDFKNVRSGEKHEGGMEAHLNPD